MFESHAELSLLVREVGNELCCPDQMEEELLYELLPQPAVCPAEVASVECEKFVHSLPRGCEPSIDHRSLLGSVVRHSLETYFREIRSPVTLGSARGAFEGS